MEDATIFPISEQKPKLKVNGKICIDCNGARISF